MIILCYRKGIIIFLIVVVLIIGSYYFLSYNKQEQDTELESTIKEALDPNKHFDTKACVVGRNIPVSGYISKKEKDFLYIESGGEGDLETKVKLTPKTLFLKMNLSSSGKLISQEEIGRDDFTEGDSVTINAFCDQSKPDEYMALIVKIILYQ